MERNTYFRPMQFRGPKLNGCSTVLLSLANRGSPRKRSGMKDSGSVKFEAEWKAARWGIDTMVCCRGMC